MNSCHHEANVKPNSTLNAKTKHGVKCDMLSKMYRLSVNRNKQSHDWLRILTLLQLTFGENINFIFVYLGSTVHEDEAV